MASLLNLSSSALMDKFITKQNVTLSFASATVNALTTDGTKVVQSVTSSVQGLTYTYSSSDTSVASISGSTITILKSGTVTITAEFAGNESYNPASASYSLVVSKANVTLSFTNATVNTTTSTSTMSVQTVTSSVQGLTITYSSGNGSVATISGTTITIVGVGTATITASFAGNDIYNSASATYSLVVSATTGIYDFEYTGAVQTKTLEAGTYKLEAWGAQGGSINTTYVGGKGGYSVGELTLAAQTTLYVYVGGQGTGGTSTGAKAGGFNGGGLGYSTSSTYVEEGGGGASDIRIGQDSLYARVIVAGGGGGAGSYNSTTRRYNGGYAGGTSGGTGGQFNTSYRGGTGGSQTTRGTSYYGYTSDTTTYGTLAAFGVGGGAISGTTNYQITGGGGGWYGGGYSRRGGGGGGSGYVYTSSTASNYPSGCLLNSSYYLSNASTTAGNTSMPKVDGTGNETGHEGNGYVRITKI